MRRAAAALALALALPLAGCTHPPCPQPSRAMLIKGQCRCVPPGHRWIESHRCPR